MPEVSTETLGPRIDSLERGYVDLKDQISGVQTEVHSLRTEIMGELRRMSERSDSRIAAVASQHKVNWAPVGIAVGAGVTVLLSVGAVIAFALRAPLEQGAAEIRERMLRDEALGLEAFRQAVRSQQFEEWSLAGRIAPVTK
jgi:hypothetical protein